jgi:DNA-binding CsgD family transcriptional regulator
VVALAAEGLTNKDIAAELDIDKSRVSRHLKKARHLSIVPTPPEANQ